MDSGTIKGIDYAVGIDLKELITVRAVGIEIGLVELSSCFAMHRENI